MRPTVEVIVPVRPGTCDQFPVAASRTVRVRAIACADGNLSALWRAAYLHSSADIVLFKHDDLWIRNWESLAVHWPLLLDYPILGVAGARFYTATQPAWWKQVPNRPRPGVGVHRGMMAHYQPQIDPAAAELGYYVPLFYGPPGPVVVVDGCCVAVRRRLWEPRPEHFSPEDMATWWDVGFTRHFYDIAFSFNASRAHGAAHRGPACYVAVADVCHQSSGPVDEPWEQAAQRFQTQYSPHGPLWV